jgi:hypothetical protein
MHSRDSFSVPLPVVAQRRCGDCTVCCTHLPIPEKVVAETAKPAGVPCPHLSLGGCGIYQNRPDVCSRFRCAWLSAEDWPETWRPEQSGLLCLREILPDGKPGSLVLESRAGALLEPQAKDILLALMRSCSVVVVVGPDGKRRRMHGCWAPEVDGVDTATADRDRRTTGPFEQDAPAESVPQKSPARVGCERPNRSSFRPTPHVSCRR